MASTLKHIFLCAALVELSLLLVQGTPHCDVPARFWCDSKEIAARCGVLDQCRESGWVKQAKKVDFVVYYESLCPDCVRIFEQQINPNFANLSSIMNLTLVPYGKATEEKVGDEWVFKCQHGDKECLGNIIQTCAIALTKDENLYVPFINCMGLTRLDPLEAAKKCAMEVPVPMDDIYECSKSDIGNKLEHKMALMTKALDPPMKYVPHCTVNGEHTPEMETQAETNLVKLICDTYKGTKPPVCQ